MKKFIWLACLAVLLASLITSCGSLRISSINARDDSALETEVEYNTLSQQSYGVDVDSKKLDYEIKKQSYDIQTKAYNTDAPTAGIVQGLLVNRYNQRQVRWVILRSPNDPITAVDEVLGPETKTVANAPIGDYIVQYYEYEVMAGETLKFTKRLHIGNQQNKGYLGAKYFFVLTN